MEQDWCKVDGFVQQPSKNLQVEDVLSAAEESNSPVFLIGGPTFGKTTFLERLKDHITASVRQDVVLLLRLGGVSYASGECFLKVMDEHLVAWEAKYRVDEVADDKGREPGAISASLPGQQPASTFSTCCWWTRLLSVLKKVELLANKPSYLLVDDYHIPLQIADVNLRVWMMNQLLKLHQVGATTIIATGVTVEMSAFPAYESPFSAQPGRGTRPFICGCNAHKYYALNFGRCKKFAKRFGLKPSSVVWELPKEVRALPDFRSSNRITLCAGDLQTVRNRTRMLRHCLRLPIGMNDFGYFINEGFQYCDQTDDLYELVKSQRFLGLLRPPGSGKTLFLSTLRYYFEGRREFFQDLKIAKLEKDWEKYPVLFFDVTQPMFCPYRATGQCGEGDYFRKAFDFFEQELDLENGRGEDVADRLRRIIQAEYQRSQKQVVVLIDCSDRLWHFSPLKSNTLLIRALYLKVILRGLFSEEIRELLKFVCLTGTRAYWGSPDFPPAGVKPYVGFTSEHIRQNFKYWRNYETSPTLINHLSQIVTGHAPLPNEPRRYCPGYLFNSKVRKKAKQSEQVDEKLSRELMPLACSSGSECQGYKLFQELDLNRRQRRNQLKLIGTSAEVEPPPRRRWFQRRSTKRDSFIPPEDPFNLIPRTSPLSRLSGRYECLEAVEHI